MTDDELDLVPMLAEEIRALTEEAAHMQENLDVIEAEISGVGEALLKYLPDSDLELVFVNCLGIHRSTLH
jgi:hypothetical protein